MAKTKKDVEEMSTADRLYDSLNYSYGKKKENTKEAYNQAIQQQDDTLLKRGMQRSSYGMATLARLQQKAVEAQGDIDSEMIADYENRLTQLEQQDRQLGMQERQLALNEAQLAENQRQFNEGQRFTAEQNALNREYSTSERIAQQEYQSGEAQKNREYSTAERIAQQEYQSGEAQKNREYSTAERIAQQEYNSGEAEKNRAFQAEQTASQNAFTAEQNALNREQNQSQFNAQMDYQRSRDAIEDAYRNEQTAFQREQWEATQAQWKQEFEYEKMSNDQKLAYNYILQTIDAGGNPSDELLAKAGISREDFNAMKKQAASAGVGGGGGGKGGNNGEEQISADEQLRRLLYASELNSNAIDENKANRDNSAYWNGSMTLGKNTTESTYINNNKGIAAGRLENANSTYKTIKAKQDEEKEKNK